MDLGQLLQLEREKAGLTRNQLAERINVSQWTVKRWENGLQPIPCDVVAPIAKALRSPRFRQDYCARCEANILTVAYPDRIDDHPVVVQDQTIEELEEAVAALKRLNLRNKRTPDSLSAEDRQQLRQAADELIEAVTASVISLGVWEQFGQSIDETRERHSQELVRAGYAGEELLAAGVA